MAVINILAVVISVIFLVQGTAGRDPRYQTSTLPDWNYHTFQSSGTTVHCWWPSGSAPTTSSGWWNNWRWWSQRTTTTIPPAWWGSSTTENWWRSAYPTQRSYHWWGISSLRTYPNFPSSYTTTTTRASPPGDSSLSTPRLQTLTSVIECFFSWSWSTQGWWETTSSPESSWSPSSSTPPTSSLWQSPTAPSSWSTEGMICLDEVKTTTSKYPYTTTWTFHHRSPKQHQYQPHKSYRLAEMIKRHALLAGSIIGGVTLFIVGTVLTAVYCCAKKATQAKVDFQPKPAYIVPDSAVDTKAEKFYLEDELPPKPISDVNPPIYTA